MIQSGTEFSISGLFHTTGVATCRKIVLTPAEVGKKTRHNKWPNKYCEYLFMSTWSMFRQNSVWHLLHTVLGQTFQHILLIGSLKDWESRLKNACSSHWDTLDGDTLTPTACPFYRQAHLDSNLMTVGLIMTFQYIHTYAFPVLQHIQWGVTGISLVGVYMCSKENTSALGENGVTADHLFFLCSQFNLSKWI